MRKIIHAIIRAFDGSDARHLRADIEAENSRMALIKDADG